MTSLILDDKEKNFAIIGVEKYMQYFRDIFLSDIFIMKAHVLDEDRIAFHNAFPSG